MELTVEKNYRYHSTSRTLGEQSIGLLRSTQPGSMGKLVALQMGEFLSNSKFIYLARYTRVIGPKFPIIFSKSPLIKHGISWKWQQIFFNSIRTLVWNVNHFTHLNSIDRGCNVLQNKKSQRAYLPSRLMNILHFFIAFKFTEITGNFSSLTWSLKRSNRKTKHDIWKTKYRLLEQGYPSQQYISWQKN